MAAGGKHNSTGDEREPFSLPIWFSGADPRILKEDPTGRIRFWGLGCAVMFTAALSGFAMFDALHMGLRAPLWVQLTVAVIWLLGISNLDRWLVTSMQRGAVPEGPWDEAGSGHSALGMALPRIGMALLLGFLLATPLNLQLFDPEIQQQIAKIHQREIDSHRKQVATGATGQQIAGLSRQRDALNKTIESNGLTPDVEADPEVQQLEAKINALQQQHDGLQQKATCEDAGANGAGCAGTTGKVGKGKFYRLYSGQAAAVQRQIDSATAQLNARKQQITAAAKANAATSVARAKKQLPNVLAELQQAQATQDSATQSFDTAVKGSTGLLIRIQALIEASKGNPITFIVQLLIWAVLMLIDCLPVIVKLGSPPGTYERLLAEQQERDLANGRRVGQEKQRAKRIEDQAMAEGRAENIRSLAKIKVRIERLRAEIKAQEDHDRLARDLESKRPRRARRSYTPRAGAVLQPSGLFRELALQERYTTELAFEMYLNDGLFGGAVARAFAAFGKRFLWLKRNTHRDGPR